MKTIAKYSLFFTAGLFLLFAACTQKDPALQVEITDGPFPEEEIAQLPELTKSEKEFGEVANKLGFAAFAELTKADMYEGQDFFYSPLSLSMNLSMLAFGAAGETRSQILDVLGLADASVSDINTYYQKLGKILAGVDKDVTIENANSVWVQDGFPVKSGYMEGLKDYYEADSFNVDFKKAEAVKEAIGKWCSDKTHGRIEKVDAMSTETVVALANALYFKAGWGVLFEKNLEEKPFTHADEHSAVESFFTGKVAVCYEKTDRLSAISIPYAGSGTYNFVVFLPEDVSDAEGISSLLVQEGQSVLKKLNAQYSRAVSVTLPKFNVEQKYRLCGMLNTLGVENAFDKNLSDFSEISGSRLWVDDIIQYTWLSVDEQGSEAAAATITSELTSTAEVQQVPVFTADRPFAFAIQEKSTGTLLFLGIKQ